MRGFYAEMTCDEYVESAKQKFLTTLLRSLDDRMSDFSKLVAGFDVVHKKMPLEEAQKSFEKLAQLIEIDAKQATMEYQDFLAQTEHEGLISTIDKTSWLVDRPKKYMNLRLVFIVSLTVPISNAEVERGFSLMNLIKNKSRSRILQDLLRNLMLIGRYKDFQFDFFKIVHKIARTWTYN